jgi:hypothetical protein
MQVAAWPKASDGTLVPSGGGRVRPAYVRWSRLLTPPHTIRNGTLVPLPRSGKLCLHGASPPSPLSKLRFATLERGSRKNLDAVSPSPPRFTRGRGGWGGEVSKDLGRRWISIQI